MRKQIGSLILISTLVSGCGGPVAMVSSSTGFMASNDFYVKAYNGIDFMTTLATDKDIKTHIYETAKNTIELGKGIKIYNKKYYSGNLTGEKAAVTEVKEEVLVSSVTTEPKVEKIEKKQTMAFTLCYLSFFSALAIGSFVFISTYGVVSLSKTKRTRKNKKGRRK